MTNKPGGRKIPRASLFIHLNPEVYPPEVTQYITHVYPAISDL